MLKSFNTKVIKFGKDDRINVDARRISQKRLEARITRTRIKDLQTLYANPLPMPIPDRDSEVTSKENTADPTAA